MNNSPDRLPGVIKEIVSALLDGDWIRYSDDSGERFYYVIRERDHAAETDLNIQATAKTILSALPFETRAGATDEKTRLAS